MWARQQPSTSTQFLRRLACRLSAVTNECRFPFVAGAFQARCFDSPHLLLDDHGEPQQVKSDQNACLVVEDLPPTVSPESLAEMFSQYGRVVNVLLKSSMSTPGRATVKMRHWRCANAALADTDGAVIDGQVVRVYGLYSRTAPPAAADATSAAQVSLSGSEAAARWSRRVGGINSPRPLSVGNDDCETDDIHVDFHRPAGRTIDPYGDPHAPLEKRKETFDF